MKKQIITKSLAILLAAYSGFVYCKIKQNEKSDQDDGVFLIDTIKAVVYGQEQNDLVTLSDVNRPSLDGNQQTLEDLVVAKLIVQDAARYKMEPDDEAVDNRLKAVQRENNLSLDELKSIFSSAGYTYEEGREQFKVMTSIGTMIDFRIRSRLIVPERDIQAYYKDNPIVQEAAYQVERALITMPSGFDRATFMQEIQRLIKTGKSKLDIEWGDPFWIKKSEIAQDKQFLTSIEVASISIGSESAAGIELFKLMNKKEEHLVSLEERYNEIAEFLKRPKYNELFEQYKKDLFASAAVVYF